MATAHPNAGGHTRTARGNLESRTDLARLSLIQTHSPHDKGFLLPLSLALCDSYWVPLTQPSATSLLLLTCHPACGTPVFVVNTRETSWISEVYCSHISVR